MPSSLSTVVSETLEIEILKCQHDTRLNRNGNRTQRPGQIVASRARRTVEWTAGNRYVLSAADCTCTACQRVGLKVTRRTTTGTATPTATKEVSYATAYEDFVIVAKRRNAREIGVRIDASPAGRMTEGVTARHLSSDMRPCSPRWTPNRMIAVRR